jgi:hypothetical protein
VVWELASGGAGALLVSPFNHGMGMLCAGWGCGGVKVLPLLGGFSSKVYLQHLSKILLLEAHFLLPPSSCHLGISAEIVFSI